MTLKVYNTLTKNLEEFKPLNPPEVLMYVCGITPYDETHLGHARAYITFDVIRRYLEFKGFKVKYVQNITDIDDKIINRAQEHKNTSAQDIIKACKKITDKYTESYFKVMEQLGVKKADVYPKATEHIDEMLKIAKKLVADGYAYELEDGIYFEVAKFKGYGKLSHRKLEDLEAGAGLVRRSLGEGGVKGQVAKKSPLDFVLWKKAKPGEPSWESPWGPGRPGWHIECSAMSSKYLGKQFDIHGGGLDLVFPHHENEIAQSECAFGKAPWVKYWIHNGFVNVDKQKMSKSLGNFFTLKDIYKKFNPMAVRIFLLGTHYRGPINFSDEQLKASEEAFNRLRRTIEDVDFYLKGQGARDKGQGEISKYVDKFVAAMDDDFNTAQGLAVIFDLASLAHKKIKEKDADGLSEVKKLIVKLAEVLGLTFKKEEIPAEIRQLAQERKKAKESKDFKTADKIRDEIMAKGYQLKDTPQGTIISALIGNRDV